jgi:hypothetical protein
MFFLIMQEIYIKNIGSKIIVCLITVFGITIAAATYIIIYLWAKTLYSEVETLDSNTFTTL